MSAERKRARPYNSPLRRGQASATRRQILAAAQELFERDGYAGTSMAAIASASGVAPKTVYLAFETKSGVLRALWHLLLRGDRDDIPVGEQPWFKEVLAEPDPREQLRLNMRNSRVVKVRAGATMHVISNAAASDPAIGELWTRIQTEFHANQRAVVQSLADKRALKDELDVDTAADILWALNHPTIYRLLAAERSWPPERYEQWMTDLLCSQLLRTPATGANQRRVSTHGG
jgi:AcrR family transcriptional regulator